MKTEHNNRISHFIRTICKDRPQEELRQAELNFLRFIKLAEKISNRLTNEKEQTDSGNTTSQ